VINSDIFLILIGYVSEIIFDLILACVFIFALSLGQRFANDESPCSGALFRDCKSFGCLFLTPIKFNCDRVMCAKK